VAWREQVPPMISPTATTCQNLIILEPKTFPPTVKEVERNRKPKIVKWRL
jgi:hypothetical protein